MLTGLEHSNQFWETGLKSDWAYMDDNYTVLSVYIKKLEVSGTALCDAKKEVNSVVGRVVQQGSVNPLVLARELSHNKLEAISVAKNVNKLD
jgi:hypothetical protein